MSAPHRLQRTRRMLRHGRFVSHEAVRTGQVLVHRQTPHDAHMLSQILTSILDMPRPALVRLTANLIDHLDRCDADPDWEDDDPDCEHDGREPDDYR